MTPWIKPMALLALVVGLAVPRAAASEAQSPAGASDARGRHGGTWAVDPRRPGPNLPPVGRSLFDFLFADDTSDEPRYRIPFPFAALREELARRLRTSPGRPPFKQVLIPLGRSLQRTAAAPEFARYPRTVLAVDGEPAPGPGASGLFLKDRLYLGYMEKADLIEVISYNEAAGRFEFQVVKGYRAGATPQVFYANRAVCTACHQNAAPIFSRPLWDETNANARVAALLEQAGRDFYGIPVQIGIDVPNGIDDATDRANQIPAIQLLWQSACGAEPDGPEARGCRARALRFALQYRLAGHLHFARADDREWQAFAATIAEGWRQQWPGGLWISNPDIPNRRPLAADASAMEGGASDHLQQQLHVPSSLDPLLPRPPLETWTAEEGAERLVIGLAGFLADVDVERLDRRLYERAAEHRRYDAPCTVTAKRRDDGSVRLSLAAGGEGPVGAISFALRGRVYLEAGRVVRGTIDRLTLPDGATLIDLEVDRGVLTDTTHGSRLALHLSHGGLHARGGDGNAIEGLEITWDPGGGVAGVPPAHEGHAVLTAMEDFPVVAALLDTLAEVGDAGDALSSRPFRRAAVLAALTAGLGMDPLRTCCIDAAALPPAVVDEHPDDSVLQRAAAQGAAEAEQGFYRYCSLCHRTNDRSPPNFLHGTPAQVRDNLAQCAERLYVRLAMWGRPGNSRSKTPMPPVPALEELGLTRTAWPGSPELAGLQRYVAGLLRSQTGSDPALDELEARGYENLRPCLANPD
jgi:cytochrome c5